MLTVRGLEKSYGAVAALRGVDLDVPAGRIMSLLGPNGAGKTTLVSIIAGLRRPDRGSVTVGGLDALAHPRAARRLLGLAPQDLGVYPVVTVRQNLALFGELAGVPRRGLRARVEEVAEALDLVDLLDRLAGTLSGGQKRRLHTAIALLHRPPLVLLDEATVGADVETRGRLLQVVQQLAADGSAILYSTHYLHEVEELGAGVTIVDAGRVIARGTVDELVARHAEPALVVRFHGPAPAVDGQAPAVDGQVTVAGDTLRVLTEAPAATAAGVLRALHGDDAARVRAVEVVRPSLESVYLALTGRRYAAEQHDETAGVPPR